MSERRSPKLNRFLASLKPAIYDQLLPSLELIALPRDCNIYQKSGKIDFAYFPISSIVAVVKLLMNGARPEVATIGNDGLVGTEVFMGGYSSTSHAIVQSAGFGYRVKINILRDLFETEPEFRNLILRFVHSLFTQATQIAACNRYHSLEEQVCRFLLTSLDRWASDRISLTHQRIADLLGVRRAGVSEVSADLAKLGFIRYHRGCVTILDRVGLEQSVCECYKVIKTEIDSILN